MMRHFKILFIALMMVGGSATSVSAENPKMATVEMQELFRGYHRTIAAQMRFNTEYARIQKAVNERGESMNGMRRMLGVIAKQIKTGKLTDEEKSKKESEANLIAQELKMMGSEVQRYADQEKRKVAQLKAASMQGIMQEIRLKVVDHSKEQGYDFVFDKSGKNTNQVSFFIYLKDAKDITANMLKELNKFALGADGH